ncbi:serine/threonine-protein kinase [Streptomyces deserti]
MGEVFAGRYELADPIGRGGVGAVWRAWDHRRRRYVAAKVLLQSDAHSLLRFVREQALRIDHPHVLAPTSWAADDDKVLFTMDLVAGGSLVHLVGDYGPLPPAFVCTLLDQLLAGLAAVHAEGVVHRDVKPANVLLEATGTGRPRLRLSDFGIAMRLGEPRLTETNLVVGTPGYLAPEQLMGAEPDFPADLFAVGLVALYLLEGAKPDSKALVQYFAEHGTPGAPKGIPEPLWQVVATLLQPDPQARFRTATGARKALSAAAELLPEPGPDDELIEIFDQLGPLPSGFGPDGPLKPASGLDPRRTPSGVWAGSSSRSGRRNVGADERENLGADEGQFSGTGNEAGPSRSGTDTPASRQGAAPGTGSAPQGPLSGTGSAPQGPAPGTGSVSQGPVPGPGPASPQSESGTGSVSHRPGTAVTPTGSGAGVVPPDPRQDTGPSPTPSVPVRPPTMSDTGSFHLPPPQATVTSSPPPAPQSHQAPPHEPQTPAQTQAHAHHSAQHQPAYVSPNDPTHPLSSPRPHAHPASPPYPDQAMTPAPQHRADASTASYTAQVPQVPPSAQGFSGQGISAQGIATQGIAAQGIAAQGITRHRADRRHRRRTGPPAKVAIPVLLLALACYAVGFWALTRI